MRAPRLLALDTSTERLVLALTTDGQTITRDEAGGAAGSARLLPAVQGLMAEAGLSLQMLDAIAFGRGPGAFTGLRTACAAAQGLAFGLRKPVLPIDSLAIVAEDARAQQGAAAEDVWVAMDARMDEAYAARYRWTGDGWHAETAPGLWPLDDLARAWQAAPPACVAGSALLAYPDRLPYAAALGVLTTRDRAAALVRLAERAWGAGAGVDPSEALPLYLRDKVAFTTAEREARAA